MSYDYLFKFVSIGDTGSGKTSFADRLVDNTFHRQHESTIGVDFRCKKNTLDSQVVIKSHIWDTAGQEKFSSIITSYYQGIAGAIIVFDVTGRQSFERVRFWYEEIQKHRHSTDPLVVLLVGNKVDRSDRQVTRHEAEAYALNHQFLYAESSCKANINIQEAFEWLVNETYKKMDKDNPGCGIKRSIPYEESIRLINDRSKLRDCHYLGDKCPKNCCTIL